MPINRKFLFSTLVASSALIGAGTVAAQAASSFVSVQSHQSYSATVSSLKEAVSSNGMMVMGQINQAKVLSMTGLKLEGAESFFVGNPNMGKKIFGMNPAAGAVLPARVYVWSDKGKAYVGYFKPSAELSEISPKLGMAGSMLDQKLQMVASQATK